MKLGCHESDGTVTSHSDVGTRLVGFYLTPIALARAQKSGNGDRQDAGDSGSCPMKTGPAPDFAPWLTAPDNA